MRKLQGRFFHFDDLAEIRAQLYIFNFCKTGIGNCKRGDINVVEVRKFRSRRVNIDRY